MMDQDISKLRIRDTKGNTITITALELAEIPEIKALVAATEEYALEVEQEWGIRAAEDLWKALAPFEMKGEA